MLAARRVLGSSTPAAAPVTLLGAAGAGAGASASMNLNRIAAQTGDLEVIVVFSEFAAPGFTVTAADGSPTPNSSHVGVNNRSMWIYTRTLSGPPVGVYTITTTQTGFMAVIIATYRGASGLDGAPSFSSANDTTPSINSIVPTKSGEVWLFMFGCDNSNESFVDPTGFTRVDSSGAVFQAPLVIVWDQHNAPIPTGAASTTIGSAASWISASVLLN